MTELGVGLLLGEDVFWEDGFEERIVLMIGVLEDESLSFRGYNLSYCTS